MSIWSVVGGAAGFMLGGPPGAALGASLGGSIDQSNAVGKAARQQADSTSAAIAEQRRQYDTAREDNAPYRAAGTQALTQLQGEMGAMPTAAEVMSDPGYQFGLQQGQLALDRKAAAAGGRVSGAALKAASQYATDYASTGYGAAYQRRQDRLNRLSALAGIGQVANSQNAQVGANTSNAISNLQSGQGNAAGAASIARGNIWANTTNSLAAAGQRWAQPGTAPSGPSNAELAQTYGFG
jgi:hypothetical protein